MIKDREKEREAERVLNRVQVAKRLNAAHKSLGH